MEVEASLFITGVKAKSQQQTLLRDQGGFKMGAP